MYTFGFVIVLSIKVFKAYTGGVYGFGLRQHGSSQSSVFAFFALRAEKAKTIDVQAAAPRTDTMKMAVAIGYRLSAIFTLVGVILGLSRNRVYCYRRSAVC
jgi:hypothetical protein